MNRQQQIDQFLHEAHRLALSRLRAQPERREEPQAQLKRWRERAGATRSDFYWDAWESLLRAPLDTLEVAVCADSDAGAALRNVSPLSVLITQSERRALLQKARAA